MRKKILSALIAGAFSFGGAAHAGLIMDLNGALPGGTIDADALDWAPTSFLAMGGNTAISNFLGGTCGPTGAGCQFDVLTHAKMTAYRPSGSGAFVGVPGGFGEITMVARYTEMVVAAAGGIAPTATFASTGAGWVEFYWSPVSDSVDLTGANFNNGTLIGRLTGVEVGKFGSFSVIPVAPVLFDQAGADDYGGQLTVRGFGAQETLAAGLASVALDPSFFITTLAGFSLQYTNISIGLPFDTTNPSDCFNPTMAAAAVGTTGLGTTCADVHIGGATMAGQGPDGGYVPVIGPVNGLGLGAPDFVAQTDFNSAVNGVPEPGSLALLGLALGGLGLAARRRKQA